MKNHRPSESESGILLLKVRGVARHKKRNIAAMGSTEKPRGTMVQHYNEQKELTFNCEPRPSQKSLEDGEGSDATDCGENRREPCSSAPEAPPDHWGLADARQPLNERICLSDECFSTRLNGCFYQYDRMKIKIYKLAYVFLFLIPLTTAETIHTGKLCHKAMESRGQLPKIRWGRRSTKEKGIKYRPGLRPANAPGVTHINRP